MTYAQRRRLPFLAALLVIGGAALAQYSFRAAVFHATAVVSAPRQIPGGLDAQESSSRLQKLHHSLAEEDLLIAALAAVGQTGHIHDVGRLNRLRGGPKIELLRPNRTSDLVRVTATSDSPGKAEAMADAAARILVRKERAAWNAHVRAVAATGSAPTVVGPTIQIIRPALPPRQESDVARLILQAASVGLLVAGAVFGVVLWRASAVDEADDLGGLALRRDPNILAVPSAALLRIPAAVGDASQRTGSSARPALSVQPVVWSWLESATAMRYGADADHWTPAIVVAPYGSLPPGTVAQTLCRAAALSFARIAAGRGARVVLVDADVAAGPASAGGVLQLPRLPGLSEAIAGNSPPDSWLLEDDEIPNLSALTAGNSAALGERGAERLTGPAVTGVLQALSGHARTIVVNGPPVLGENSNPAFWAGAAQWASAVLLINDVGEAAEPLVQQAAAELLALGLPVLGKIDGIVGA